MKISKLKTLLLASAVVVGVGTSVLAAPLVIVVPNPSGNGVSVYTNSTITDMEYAILTGLDAPPEAPGQTILFLEEGAPPRWTNDTIDEIDRRHRGDGSPPVQDLSKVPFKNGDVIELSQADEKQPIEIFDEDDDGDKGGPDSKNGDEKEGDDDGLPNVSIGIQPKDGNWIRTAGTVSYNGCGTKLPGMINAALPAFPDEVRNITFSNPFNPQTDLGFDDQLLISWAQSSPGEWTGFVELPSQGGGAAGIEFGISMEVELLSNTEIDVVGNVNVRLSDLTAGILESSTFCTSIAPMTLRYSGS